MRVIVVGARRMLAVQTFSASGCRSSRGREQGQIRVRAAPRALFGSYCREHARGRRLIVLALQAAMDSDTPKESRSDACSWAGAMMPRILVLWAPGGRLSKKMGVLPSPLRQAVCLAEGPVIPSLVEAIVCCRKLSAARIGTVRSTSSPVQ